MGPVLTVFTADLRNTLRDRRTWLAMVIIPLLLVPVLLIAAPSALQQGTDQAAPHTVAVAGAEHAPALIDFLKASGELALVEASGSRSWLEEGEARAVLVIDPGLERAIAGGASGTVTILYDAASLESEAARSKIQRLVAEYASSVVAGRLIERGIDPALLVPIVAEAENVAPEERIGGFFLSMIMPMLLAVWAALGGMYAAIDAVAGEKERGTLEPLLAAPTPRQAIVAGKYFVVVVTSVAASMIALLGMYIGYLIKPEAILGPGAAEGARFMLPATHALLMLGVNVLLAAFFSAIELAVSAFARTFREAQSYLSPLSLVVVIPALFTQFVSPAEVAPLLYAVPVVNAILVLKELLLGTVDWTHLGALAVSSVACIAGALYLAAAVFRKESVLFRT